MPFEHSYDFYSRHIPLMLIFSEIRQYISTGPQNEYSECYLPYIKLCPNLSEYSEDASKRLITSLKLAKLKKNKNTVTKFSVASSYLV